MLRIPSIVICVIYFLCNLSFADELGQIESYINSISTLHANFQELDVQKGITRSGVLSISRPGKIIWEYLKPDKKVIIVSDNKVTYYDYELEELSSIPVKSTLLSILSRAPLSLKKDCRVLSIYGNASDEYIDMAVTDNDDAENAVVIKFKTHPEIAISHFGILDQSGEVITEISLSDIEYGVDFPKNTFSFHDPKFFDLSH